MQKQNQEEEFIWQEVWEDVEEQYEEPGLERPFEEMRDEEIIAELTIFYKKHDPDNLEKLQQVLMLSRNLGRPILNEKLREIYGESLTPAPVIRLRIVQKQVKKKGWFR